MEQIIHERFENRHIEVLDAGCGRKWQIKLQMPITITGVDADQAALDKREDLDVALKEDIQTVDFPSNRFDLIYCSYVLEHVNGAEDLLGRFKSWLKPNGLLILRFPDKYTVFGFITRKTPHWVHVIC
ncbi:MAG: class I SAM-dependent methyltransferase [Gammaproteobacteria bacterium]|nr:class I SAM-dependent methyltransferase [Gammaproteobacteria bacterium]